MLREQEMESLEARARLERRVDRPSAAALALLLATVAKVFLYDLASLPSIHRVASSIVLGLLLLGGAFAWPRMRPRAIPDLREMPEALR